MHGVTAMDDPARAGRAGTSTHEHLRSPFAFVMHYVHARRAAFAGLTATVVLAASCSVVIQWQIKLLVDAMTGLAQGQARAWHQVGVLVVLIAVESLFWRASGWLACRATLSAGVLMRLDLFRYLSGQSIRYFADNLAGSLGQRITGMAGNFGALMNTCVWRVAPPCIDFIGGLAVFSAIDWRMAATMAVYVLLVTGWLFVVGRRGRPLHATYHARASEVAGNVVDVISNMWAVKAFTAREREWSRLREQFAAEAALQSRSWMYLERTRLFYDVILWAMATVMLIWAVYSWSHRGITAGDVVVITALTFRILHGSRDVTLAFVDLTQQFGYMDDTLRVIGQVHSIVDPPRARTLRSGRGRVEFRRISFGYDPRQPILQELDLRIRAGEKVGIVGPSGAGKTTLLQLIQRLHDPQSGLVLLDGQPVNEVTQDSLRAAIAVVPQEIMLFHRTVLENIRFGRPEASIDEVMIAAQAACCDHFVRGFPLGFNTLVGERGVKLSGGQRQRIGIARALLKQAPVLILDEATSALDTETEMAIQRNIIELLRERTVIAVAHRLSTLANFDRILVVHHGRIVEEGTAAELRRRGRIFQRMWEAQANGLDLSVPLVGAAAGAD